jgi:hypothetical protein
MMFFPMPHRVSLDDRPERDSIINHDEIISMRIDLEILTADQFCAKYCDQVQNKKSTHQLFDFI